MRNFLIFVFIVILAGLGYFLMTQEDSITDNENTATLSVSFTCKDGSDFRAEFPDNNTVKISTTSFQILPLMEGAGKRFEDQNSIYVFAGEEATVTNKKTNQTTTCEQLSDGNKAPVNFWDAGEGGGTKQDISLAVNENIIGRWQSTTDTKFIRIFSANGSVEDIYDNKDATQRIWTVFTKEKPMVVEFPLESDTVYIQLMTAGAQAEKLYFKVGKLTPESLELISMDKGVVLQFTSVQ